MTADYLSSASCDVLVVGAGPAGSAAAITLARLGRSVTVIDKASFPRDKTCGDGLTTAALRRLEHLGLDPAGVASWQPVEGVSVVSPTGREVRLPLGSRHGGWFAVSAQREHLDAALVAAARREGAWVEEGVPATKVAYHDSGRGVVVHTGDGRRLCARYVLACDGMWSPLRRSLGLTEPGYLGEWQAGRRYLRGTGPRARRLWVWFEPDMIPGYAWSFPLPGGRVNFGYGVLRAPGAGLRGQGIDWADRSHIAEVLGPDAEPDGPWRAWPIPARIGRSARAALGGRVLFCGDAAGACDVMTGEGIAQALETGEAAARAVAQAGPDRPELAARRYGRVLSAGMALDDALAARLSRVLARAGGADRALSAVDASDWCRRNFARWMFEDYPRAAVLTPHRWRRRMFTAPGAYRHLAGDWPGGASMGQRRVGPPAPAEATFAGHD